MKRISLLALAVTALASLSAADGTGSNKGLRTNSSKAVAAAKSGPEIGLIGVNLYDTGLVLINKFGSPDEIQDVASGTTSSIGPAGGGGAAGGAQGGGARGGGRGGESDAGLTSWNVPGLDWKPINFQGPEMATPQQQQPGAVGAGAGAPAGRPAGGQPAGGGAGPTTLNTRVVYTRWVYRRGNSRFAFILNRYNQIIQIEAIGMSDSRVSTRRGVRYGAEFGEIMKKYGAPDGYEIGGNTLVVRYLVDHKVAFRLNRLKTDGKHVVTGIVVAAGKM